ncbi:hypothetical protein PUNSTDRAFT_96221 [Punctularia strigosozonata HHB-11173 SS5]|uniref:uncharacterized protein n=1 Tax=Punctularia strigosozonata (strain HHB-11173) TaxID=741275 RepID=UPI0004416EB1|nr:uncharacterized protein PUNSTDRAFT_96221 [Punctularia strigosozonata HHB-11173 SS5]EIN14395.1 hypothetical protein PUNSTDRAFT_96221 [Punctularia strigosozonata HHB-11173 SS5]
MELPKYPAPFVSSPITSPRSRSNTKLVDDITSLTSFNPFAEEDENDQSSYALVSSLFSKVKNSLAGPLASVGAGTTSASNVNPPSSSADQRRPSTSESKTAPSISQSRPLAERPTSLQVSASKTAAPMVSLTPVVSDAPSLNAEHDRPSSRSAQLYSPSYDPLDGGAYGTSIPGFPIADDARSVRTTMSSKPPVSISKAIRRIRGEGLSRDYWMDDDNAKECYDCKTTFTAWRRKHHCRICGQIFCARCASNIMNGGRFGHDGMIRVCNLCLEQASKTDDDDDDDRRSIVSSATSPFPPHQLGHPHSPFSAFNVFGRKDDNFNLFSIAERRWPIPEDGNGSVYTPRNTEEDDQMWEAARGNIAPFRRAQMDDDKDSGASSPHLDARDISPSPNSNAPIEFPASLSVRTDGLSTIQFPTGVADQAYPIDSPGPHNMSRSRLSSFNAEHDSSTPFIRSRVQSRLSYDSNLMTEYGWRTRRESTAYAQELNLISMFHLRIMLQQMLKTENIPNPTEWEDVLMKLALRIAREMTFTALPQRQGAEMDVRRYVKIKKIPGGSPSNSEYVDGAVITKNVAHKQMLRNLRNPRVMLVTFPLEFHRVEGQYMHFGQIVRQEKEYLGNLATRIAALRPHVILVQKSVSRLALDQLAKHNIAVARSVKESAITFISRMTQGDIFSSMDKLVVESRLGHCQHFRIQTFDHPLIPGRRKTYLRFEGCNPDMGCTILLRGGDIETLRRVKKVTRFLVFTVRNLKLETHLWKDSVIALPNLTNDAAPAPYSSQVLTSSEAVAGTTEQNLSEPSDDDDLPTEDAKQLRVSRRIQDSLDPYLKTFISVSATLRFPPPYPIRRMKELDEQLMRDKRAWEDEVISREEKSQVRGDPGSIAQPTLVTPDETDKDDIRAMIESLPAPDIPRTPASESQVSTRQELGYFDQEPVHVAGSVPSSPLPSALSSDHQMVLLKTSRDIALESRLSHVQWQHEEQRRIWEWYLRKNKDDLNVEKYQNIALWEMKLPINEYGHRRPCFPPQMKYMTFYGENDCTLGRFIEKSVHETLVHFLDPKAICSGKGCNQPIARHCTVYVHHEAQILVAVEQWDGQINGRAYHPLAPELITTWSLCRVCGSVTPFIPVSEEMQRYSMAKFLELHFYPADVELVQGAGCHHNIYTHHIRYFAYRGMTIRFQTDPIVLHEVVYPPMRIRVRPETLLELKNADYQRLLSRNELWYAALIGDLKNIKIDAATGDEEYDSGVASQVNILINRAKSEREEIAKLLKRLYDESDPTDTLALNQARAYRQDKIVAWQQDFDKLPKPKMGGFAVDKRRVSGFGTVSGLGSMWQKYGFLDNQHLPSSSVSEAEEGLPRRRVTGDSIASTLSSDASASESEAGDDVPMEGPAGEFIATKGPTESPVLNEEGADSDSTIGASRGPTQPSADTPSSPIQERRNSPEETMLPRLSRLPRRTAQQPTVADLVKRYSEVLPPEGVRDLAKTALAPHYPISESEQEYASRPSARPLPRHRNRPVNKPVFLRKSSVSDFESSYAANIAPRYLTPARRPTGTQANSRIPGPAVPSIESTLPSRRASPDKRPSLTRNGTEDTIKRTQAVSPVGETGLIAGPSQIIRVKGSNRPFIRERGASRPSSAAAGKSTLRKQPVVPGSRVSHIAKHFERITRDQERANRRYAVIRGRRARPVASSRARVEILDSVKDAINDEFEASDSSSEADDEGEGDEEGAQATDVVSGSPSASPFPNSDSRPGASTSLDTINDDVPVLGKAVHQDPSPVVVQDLTPSLDISVSAPSSPLLSAANATKVQGLSTPPQSDLEVNPNGADRNSMLRQALSSLWPAPLSHQRHRMDLDGDDPLADPEHIFRDASMVVRTDEPTSIIALVLNSPQYREMLTKSRAEKRQAREPKVADGSGEAFMPDDRSVAESTSTWGVVNVDSSDSANPTEEMRVPSSKLPWVFTFESSGLEISCTVLFPEQFDALRRTYDCEKRMVESLARCVKWDASGGKSGSAFLKTKDDRFIAKELSRAELQAMATFAPAYFDYMSSAVVAQRPTLLAKVFGCYKITFRKTQDQSTSRTRYTQMNLLVMENLFYDRRFSKARIYDLKGSTRNRRVQSTGRENEVLLDENLVESAHTAPFYLREHSKRILRGALFNDSKFLADVNVMDYSLVVGVDSVNNELVVGIVDYIRTYTWDKKLESWVKDSAFLGGGGSRGEPTIITPKQYRQRFISAMERYFPLVPDRWMKQQDAPEEDIGLSELWPDW